MKTNQGRFGIKNTSKTLKKCDLIGHNIPKNYVVLDSMTYEQIPV